MFALVVTQAFADHAKGDRISDAETVATILGSEAAAHVVKVPVHPLDHDADGRKGGSFKSKPEADAES